MRGIFLFMGGISGAAPSEMYFFIFNQADVLPGVFYLSLYTCVSLSWFVSCEAVSRINYWAVSGIISLSCARVDLLICISVNAFAWRLDSRTSDKSHGVLSENSVWFPYMKCDSRNPTALFSTKVGTVKQLCCLLVNKTNCFPVPIAESGCVN